MLVGHHGVTLVGHTGVTLVVSHWCNAECCPTGITLVSEWYHTGVTLAVSQWCNAGVRRIAGVTEDHIRSRASYLPQLGSSAVGSVALVDLLLQAAAPPKAAGMGVGGFRHELSIILDYTLNKNI